MESAPDHPLSGNIVVRVVQSQEERFTGSKTLRGFIDDYNIGWMKTLPGRPLLIGREPILLPPRCHLEADAMEIVAGVRHDTILLVENWECFDRIHAVQLDFSVAGPDPLVLWRGGSG